MTIKVLVPVVKQASSLGTNTYRVNDESVPINLRSVLRWTARENAAKTVARSTIRMECPKVRSIDGTFVSTEKAVIDISVAIPQNIVDATLSVDMLDTMISVLTKAKADIANGVLPTVAI